MYFQETESHADLIDDVLRLTVSHADDGPALIEKILQHVGPRLDVSRACFNQIFGRDTICVFEWCEPGVAPSIGTHFPIRFLKHFMRDGPVALSETAALSRVPRIFHPMARPLIASLAQRLDLSEVVVAACHGPDRLEGVLTFDVCAERAPNPERSGRATELAAQLAPIVARVLRASRAPDESERPTFHAGAVFLPYPVFTVDQQLRIQSWNHECIATFGHGMDIIGQPLMHLFRSPIQSRRANEQVAKACAHMTGGVLDLRLNRLDGNTCVMRCRFVPMSATETPAPHCVIFCHNE
jgi:hypothetical protein